MWHFVPSGAGSVESWAATVVSGAGRFHGQSDSIRGRVGRTGSLTSWGRGIFRSIGHCDNHLKLQNKLDAKGEGGKKGQLGAERRYRDLSLWRNYRLVKPYDGTREARKIEEIIQWEGRRMPIGPGYGIRTLGVKGQDLEKGNWKVIAHVFGFTIFFFFCLFYLFFRISPPRREKISKRDKKTGANSRVSGKLPECKSHAYMG